MVVADDVQGRGIEAGGSKAQPEAAATRTHIGDIIRIFMMATDVGMELSLMCRAEGEKLVAAGLMLEGLQAAATGQQFGDTIWTFTRPQTKGSSGGPQPIGRHKLSAGANVAVLPMPATGQPGQPSQVPCCFCQCYLGRPCVFTDLPTPSSTLARCCSSTLHEGFDQTSGVVGEQSFSLNPMMHAKLYQISTS